MPFVFCAARRNRASSRTYSQSRLLRRLRYEQLESRWTLSAPAVVADPPVSAAANPNLPPVLADPPNQTIPWSQDSVTVVLAATDPNPEDVLSFAVSVHTAEYYLDQTIGFNFTGDLSFNFGGLDEKWLLADHQTWYYLVPSGDLWHWKGGALSNADLITRVDSATYDDPARLYDAQPGGGPATATLSDNILTIDPDDGFVGFLRVDIVVSDGSFTDTQQMLITVTGNRPPTLTHPGDLLLVATQGLLDVPLEAVDPDNNPLTFSVVAHSGEFFIDQSIGLNYTGDFALNFGGLDEKWLLGDDGSWYYLVPAGGLWRWLGGSTSNAELVANLSSATYENPSLLYDAQPGGSTAVVTITGTTLTIDPAEGFTGIFAVDVTVSDGELSTTERIRVTVTTNQDPVLGEHEDPTLPTTQDQLTVTLSATDADNDPLTFSAVAHSGEYYLDQVIGFNFTSDFALNFGGLGEKWLLASDSQTWYYLTPEGGVWRWLGGPALNAEWVAQLDPATFADPARLYDAQPGGAPGTVTVNGETLTIDPDPGFVGIFGVQLAVSDGKTADTDLILVTVVPPPNQPPVLTNPGSQSMPTTLDTLTVSLEAADADGDPLTFQADVHTGEYYFDRTLGLNFLGDYSLNFAGLNEKWLQADDRTWYYLTPDGALWKWLGGAPTNSELIALLSESTYEDPARLHDAQPGSSLQAARTSEDTLTIDPPLGFIGVFGVEITVSDGQDTDSVVILVTVDPFSIVGAEHTVGGKSYDRRAEDWFQWLAGDTVAPATAFPFDFPLTDTIGTDAVDNQVDPDVFFIGGVFGASAERTFAVPANKRLFIALAASFWTNSTGGNPELGVISTRQTIDAINQLFLQIDGVEIPESTLFGLRAGSARFSATFAQDNWFDLATSGGFPAGTTSGHSIDGYWVLTDPLSPGTHTIRFGGASSGSYLPEGGFTAEQIAGSADLTIAFSQDIRLNLVVPEPSVADSVWFQPLSHPPAATSDGMPRRIRAIEMSPPAGRGLGRASAPRPAVEELDRVFHDYSDVDPDEEWPVEMLQSLSASVLFLSSA